MKSLITRSLIVAWVLLFTVSISSKFWWPLLVILGVLSLCEKARRAIK